MCNLSCLLFNGDFTMISLVKLYFTIKHWGYNGDTMGMQYIIYTVYIYIYTHIYIYIYIYVDMGYV